MIAAGSVRKLVRVTYLEMLARGELRPSGREPGHTLLLRAEEPCPELGRFLYAAVGGDWFWRDRLIWTWAEWLERLSLPEVETWVLYSRGTPAGYFELEAAAEGSVQLVYFGLLSSFVGRGLGGYLLTRAIERAWAMRPDIRRVWVHTCTLDHPAALANYTARGFRVFKEEDTPFSLPMEPPGPWPGSQKPRR